MTRRRTYLEYAFDPFIVQVRPFDIYVLMVTNGARHRIADETIYETISDETREDRDYWKDYLDKKLCSDQVIILAMERALMELSPLFYADERLETVSLSHFFGWHLDFRFPRVNSTQWKPRWTLQLYEILQKWSVQKRQRRGSPTLRDWRYGRTADTAVDGVLLDFRFDPLGVPPNSINRFCFQLLERHKAVDQSLDQRFGPYIFASRISSLEQTDRINRENLTEGFVQQFERDQDPLTLQRILFEQFPAEHHTRATHLRHVADDEIQLLYRLLRAVPRTNRRRWRPLVANLVLRLCVTKQATAAPVILAELLRLNMPAVMYQREFRLDYLGMEGTIALWNDLPNARWKRGFVWALRVHSSRLFEHMNESVLRTQWEMVQELLRQVIETPAEDLLRQSTVDTVLQFLQRCGRVLFIPALDAIPEIDAFVTSANTVEPLTLRQQVLFSGLKLLFQELASARVSAKFQLPSQLHEELWSAFVRQEAFALGFRWEGWCATVADAIYGECFADMRSEVLLPNGTRPDLVPSSGVVWQNGRIFHAPLCVDAKLSVYELFDADKYLSYCDRLEYWVLIDNPTKRSHELNIPTVRYRYATELIDVLEQSCPQSVDQARTTLHQLVGDCNQILDRAAQRFEAYVIQRLAASSSGHT